MRLPVWMKALVASVFLLLARTAAAEAPHDYLMVHGIRETETAWNVGQNSLLPNTLLGRASSFQLGIYDWRRRLTEEATEMRDHLAPTPRDLTAIAYSQGSIVSRTYIRQFNADPASPHIGSLVTIGGLHQGAPILNHLVYGARSLEFYVCAMASTFIVAAPPQGVYLNPTNGTWYIKVTARNWKQGLFAAGFIGGMSWVHTALNGMVDPVLWAPARQDLVPGSALINTLNANVDCERTVNRAGITGRERFPQLYRLLGPAVYQNDPGENDVAPFVAAQIANLLDLLAARNLLNWINTGNIAYYDKAFDYFARAYLIRCAPTGWNMNVVGSMDNDGIVPTSSQAYPGLDDPRFQVVLDGVNHTGYRGSSVTTNAVLNVLTLFDPATANALPAVPTALSPTGGAGVCTATSLRLSWASRCDRYAYSVQVATDAAFTTGLREWSGVPQTYLDVTSLAPNTVHYWRVRASMGGRDGDWSPTASFRSTMPPSVTGFTNSLMYGTWEGETCTKTVNYTPTGCGETIRWRVTNPASVNYAIGFYGTTAVCSNLGILSPYTLGVECTITNVAGTTTATSGFALKVGARPADGGCPFVYEWTPLGFVEDNNVLPQVDRNPSARGALADYYRLRMTPDERDGLLTIALGEKGRERSTFDRVSLLAVDHPSGTRLVVGDDGAMVAVRSLGVARVEQKTDAGTLHQRLDGSQPTGELKTNAVARIDWDTDEAAAPEFAPSRGVLIKGVAPAKQSPNAVVIVDAEGEAQSGSFRHRTSDALFRVPDGRSALDLRFVHPASLESGECVEIVDEHPSIRELKLARAVHLTAGDVGDDVARRDDRVATLVPGGRIELGFEPLPAEDGFERSYVLRVEGRYEHLSPEEAGEVVASSNLGAPDMALASKGSGRDLVLSARVPGAGDARLTIVDIGGRKVTEWDRVPSTGGEFRVADRTPLEPGVYFARLTWEAADHNRMEQRAIKVVVVQ